MTNQEMLINSVEVHNLISPKHLLIHHFHVYNINTRKNHMGIILKSNIITIIVIIFVVVLSDF